VCQFFFSFLNNKELHDFINSHWVWEVSLPKIETSFSQPKIYDIVYNQKLRY